MQSLPSSGKRAAARKTDRFGCLETAACSVTVDDVVPEDVRDKKTRTAIIHRAHEHHLAGRYAEAIADYDILIRGGFAHPEVFANRAISRQRLGDQQGAIGDCDEALSRQPDSTLTLYTRGLSHKKLGNYQAALRDLETVLRLDPAYEDAHYTKAWILSDMEEWEASLPHWSAYIAAHPRDCPSRQLL
jgi:tetratricopeptide (TPR) repeat protein